MQRPQTFFTCNFTVTVGSKLFPSIHATLHTYMLGPARQNGDFGWNFTYFPLIFRRFFCQWYPISPFFCPHVYGFYLFLPISIDFPPIFCLKWYPILAINSSMVPPSAIFLPTCLWIPPIFCLCSAHFLPIFHLTFCSFSAGPVLQGDKKNY